MLTKYSYYLISIFRLLFGFYNWPTVLRAFLGQVREDEITLLLKSPKLNLLARSPMDIWSVKETFLDRFYEKCGTKIQNHWTIVDIGAGLGDFALFAGFGYPENRVLAFEPFLESLTLLKKNLQRNGLNNIEAHPEAIWSHSGQITLDLRENEPLQISSLAEEIQSGDGMSISVPSLSIADMFEEYQIDQCDLLKMDCEGAEYEIILNLNIDILNRVARIVMEYHNNVTSYTHSDLVSYLETRGYRVRITPNRVHDYLGYLYAERM